QEDRYKNSSFTATEIEQCYKNLEKLMEMSMPYKDVKLSLPNLAKQLKVSPNLLSQTINQRTKMNFPDFINSYRIRFARELLNSPAYSTHKISAIAFETGFNTLSAFNTAFRKFTLMTPSGFRKKSVYAKPGENNT
ncbi:MAG: helix-turn-helix domain-containing protein, partial [Chitinophagaceae bacterium]